MSNSELSIEFCGKKCENPFFLASAPVTNNYKMVARALERGWGGLVFKTIGLFIANEVSPRFDQLKKENTSFLGFRNLEQTSEYPLEQNLENMKKIKKNYPDKILIASILGRNKKEWTKLAKMVTEVGVDMIECNFSCPQMEDNGLGSDVGQNPELVNSYIKATLKGTELPVIAKMTPNLGHMVPPAVAAVKGGASGLAAINTIKSITSVDINNYTPNPVIEDKSSVSGYSGKAVKPIALRFIHEMASYPDLKKIPISGIGGIETWRDALEFILLGARNVQIGTAVMQYGYRIIDDLTEGLKHYLEEKNITNVEKLIGRALDNTVSPDSLNRDKISYPVIKQNKCIGCGRCYRSCQDGGHQAIIWHSSRKPAINQKKCVGCHLCLEVCPAGAIEAPAEAS